MYGFRKPFTAASFDSDPFEPGMKAWFVTAQVLGYMLSKFIGIKVVSEMPPHRRAWTLLGLIGIAETALLLFALCPPPYSLAFLFLNGLPLGMVFGLVLGFLEGRQLTEAFVAGLCTSFILADGVVKSVGAWLLSSGVTEAWMPFTAGLVFLLPLCGFVWMLQRIPPPTQADEIARSPRKPMGKAERQLWIRSHGLSLGLIVFSYLLVTIMRSIRADFAPELWNELGLNVAPAVYTQSEMWVALGVMAICGAVVTLKDNRKALFTALGIAIAGLGLVLGTLWGHGLGWIAPFPFMVLIGLGLYLPYVVVHTTVFERLIAVTRDPGNIGFFMYLADAFGYLGYVLLMIFGSALPKDTGALPLFRSIATVAALIGIVAFVAASLAFRRKTNSNPDLV